MNTLDKVASLKNDCRVVGIYPPKYVLFKHEQVNLHPDMTFSEARIKDGDTISFDIDAFISDPNIFESVFSNEIHDCIDPKCKINAIISQFQRAT